jgi:hypothetical protein
VLVMDGVLASALRDGTYGWLERVALVLRNADVPSRAALAEVEMPRLMAAVVALLADHEADEDGRCRVCARWRWGRGVRCSVWVTAHRYLVVDDRAGDETGRHAMSSVRGSA